MLEALCDSELLSETKKLVGQERGILAQVLRHLREIERRRLFSDLKYKSLFEYATRELGYSEDQAYRRINAMRLIKELPQIEEKITDGSLSLSNLGVATNLFNAEKKVNGAVSVQKKLEVIRAIENKSRREAEVVVQSMTDLPKQTLRPDKIRVVDDFVEIRMTARLSLERKINRVKGAMAHSCPGISTADLFEKLCDEFLVVHEKKMAARKKDFQARAMAGTRPPQPDISAPSKSSASSGRRSMPTGRAALSSAVKRVVWSRDSGRCRNCGSGHALEFDHVLPLANGGGDTAENLRLLCRQCNQREAIKKFGVGKMALFIEKRPSNLGR